MRLSRTGWIFWTSLDKHVLLGERRSPEQVWMNLFLFFSSSDFPSTGFSYAVSLLALHLWSKSDSDALGKKSVCVCKKCAMNARKHYLITSYLFGCLFCFLLTDFIFCWKTKMWRPIERYHFNINGWIYSEGK